MVKKKNPKNSKNMKSKTTIIIPSLPAEIITEILLRLPVKPLLRCKSVCKDWYSLISDKHFIKSHYTLSSSSTNSINYQHHRLICIDERNSLISCPLYDVLFHKCVNNALMLENPLEISNRVRIAGSCNGLICIFAELTGSLVIYNPATRRSNLLPSLPCSLSAVRYLGFGYDELSRDYKVVIARKKKLPTIIYSLNTREWKEIGRFPSGTVLNGGKFTNGTLHWETRDESSSDSWKIVSLDLASETYGEILQPKYHHEGGDCLELGVMGEWLCVVNDHYESNVVDVWVMKVYGVKESWTILASIPHPDHWRGLVWDPLCISKDGKLLVQLGVQLLIYDSKDSSSSLIENKYYDACIVVESLVSPLGLADNNDDED